ncbi:MAG: SusC/RagA family TonB-linked outer membrane protein, partial [Bacteroidales bacterium]
MKKRSKLMQGLFLILFWALGLNVYAQSLMVTGTVKDASDGSSLPGVTILVKNTQTGTTSDFDGKYSLSVAKGSVLVYSFIGYETVEAVVADATTMNISLKPASTNLDEIVVIGYGQVRKGDATGAITSVSVKDFNSGSITNPLELMTGKTAGVQITNNSGAPGSGATIRIRGGSSLSASNDPLYVIDGIPVDNDGISGTRNAMSTINPNDIETFTILKDASATAIYGARASNGVIIITTKKGSATNNSKKPFKLEYTGNFSLYTIPQKREVFNGDEFRTIIFDRFAGKENVLGMLGTESTDWQSEIFRNSFGMDHNVSVSGAYKTLPYRLSIGYSAHDGILETDNMKRTNIGLTLNPTFFDDHLKVNLSAKGMFITQRFANEGAIGSAIQMNPTQPVFNADGTYYALLQTDSTPVNQATKNPVALIEQREDNSKVNRFLGNAQFDYKFHFLPELHANLNLGYDYSSTDGDVFVPGDAQFLFDALYGGGLNLVYDQMKKNEILDFTLNYSKEIPSIKSKLDLMGGYSWQHFYR